MVLNVRYGGKESKPYRLGTNQKVMVVRSKSYRLPMHADLTTEARSAMDALTPLMSIPRAGIQLFEHRAGGRISRVRTLPRQEKDGRFARSALKDPSAGGPVILSRKAVLRFPGGQKE